MPRQERNRSEIANQLADLVHELLVREGLEQNLNRLVGRHVVAQAGLQLLQAKP